MSSALRRLGRRRPRAADAGPGAGVRGAMEEAAGPLEGYDPDAGLPFDAAELERRLVWMWGSPRSGSTWLLKQLCHPLVPDPEAMAIFHAPAEASAPFEALPVDESFLSNHLSPAFADPREIDGVYVPGTLNNYLGERPVYALSRGYENVWRPEARRFALVRLYGFLARAAAAGAEMAPDALVVIKEVNGSHASDLIMSLMPRSRLLFLVRDGRDVVDSLLHAYQPGGFLARHQSRAFETPEERREGLRWAARVWSCNVDMTQRAIAAHPPELTHVVRYEDLLTANEARVEALDRWLGLSRDHEARRRMLAETSFAAVPPQRKGARERNRAATPGLWRENLSQEEAEIAMEIMGPRLERLGYETL